MSPLQRQPLLWAPPDRTSAPRPILHDARIGYTNLCLANVHLPPSQLHTLFVPVALLSLAHARASLLHPRRAPPLRFVRSSPNPYPRFPPEHPLPPSPHRSSA